MKRLTMISAAWDTWQATRGGMAAIQQRRQERFQFIVAYARQHSKFYQAHYRDVPETITDVTQLPPVNKCQLMAHFEDWLTDPEVTRESVAAFLSDMSNLGTPYLGKYMVWTTSGTTGDPAILLHDANWVAVASGISLARVIPVCLTWKSLWSVIKGGRRMAAIFSTTGHYLGVTMAERQRKSSRLRARAIRTMSALTPLPQLVRDLNAFQPVMIGGYASVLTLLAKEQLAGRLHITPVMISSGGETLSDAMRATIERAFHTTAWNNYSSSETGIMAQQCRHGNLHFNADWFIVEPVDSDGQPVPPGTRPHKIYVTNLVTTIQPIIRYAMGDSVIFDPSPCACGSPLPVLRVEGRTDDILELVNADGSIVHLLPLAVASVVEETTGVKRYQIMQTGHADLTIRLEVMHGAERESVWRNLSERLGQWFVQQGAVGVKLCLAQEAPQMHPNSGKLRHVFVANSREAASVGSTSA